MRAHRLVVLALLTSSAACTQPSGGAPPAPSTSAAPVAVAAGSAPVAWASPAPATAPVGSRDEDEDLSVPTEKFGDPEKAFAAAMTALKTQYYASGLTDEDLYRAAVRGMLTNVDPPMRRWNKLLSPRQYAELSSDISGQLVGIGVRIKFDPATGHIDVLGTIPGAPAEKAGIRATDTIVSIDGKLFKGKTERDAVEEIRGKAGATVTLSVLRDDKILPFTVTRALVAFDDVEHTIEEGIGYLSVRTFSARTAPAVKLAFDDFVAGHVRAIALDLRANMGGSFDEAVHVAEQFLPSGTPIVTLQRRDGKSETMTSKGTPALATIPVVVLVDHGTASSGELLAGALSEGRHAKTVGARTYGKWTVQTVEQLGNGYAIKFTTAIFHTPSGKSYDGVGFAPDVQVDEEPEKIDRNLATSDLHQRFTTDPQIRTAVSLLTP